MQSIVKETNKVCTLEVDIFPIKFYMNDLSELNRKDAL